MSKVLTITSMVCLGILFGATSNIALADTIVSSLSATHTTSASAQVRFNNENWFTSPHPEPASFTITQNGEAYGTTTTGIPFTQTNVSTDQGVRVQMFSIQDHYHYIVAGRLVYASDNLEAAIIDAANSQLGSRKIIQM